MLLVPLNRVDRPPPGGVGQFQTPFRMGVSALLVAALLNQSPSAALAIESGSKLAAACTEQPARTPPQPASEVKAGTSVSATSFVVDLTENTGASRVVDDATYGSLTATATATHGDIYHAPLSAKMDFNANLI